MALLSRVLKARLRALERQRRVTPSRVETNSPLEMDHGIDRSLAVMRILGEAGLSIADVHSDLREALTELFGELGLPLPTLFSEITAALGSGTVRDATVAEGTAEKPEWL